MLLTSQRPSMFKLLYHADGCESREGGALLRVFVQKMLFNLLLQSRLQVHSLRRDSFLRLLNSGQMNHYFDLHTRNGNTDKSRKDHHDTSMTPKKWYNYKSTCIYAPAQDDVRTGGLHASIPRRQVEPCVRLYICPHFFSPLSRILCHARHDPDVRGVLSLALRPYRQVMCVGPSNNSKFLCLV